MAYDYIKLHTNYEVIGSVSHFRPFSTTVIMTK